MKGNYGFTLSTTAIHFGSFSLTLLLLDAIPGSRASAQSRWGWGTLGQAWGTKPPLLL